MADLNKKKKENRIKFDGNFLTLIRPSKTRRKFIVSKTFMKLWFKTIENDFDEQLYELMDEKNKKLFIETYVFWLNQVPNTNMQTSFVVTCKVETNICVKADRPFRVKHDSQNMN